MYGNGLQRFRLFCSVQGHPFLLFTSLRLDFDLCRTHTEPNHIVLSVWMRVSGSAADSRSHQLVACLGLLFGLEVSFESRSPNGSTPSNGLKTPFMGSPPPSQTRKSTRTPKTPSKFDDQIISPKALDKLTQPIQQGSTTDLLVERVMATPQGKRAKTFSGLHSPPSTLTSPRQNGAVLLGDDLPVPLADADMLEDDLPAPSPDRGKRESSTSASALHDRFQNDQINILRQRLKSVLNRDKMELQQLVEAFIPLLKNMLMMVTFVGWNPSSLRTHYLTYFLSCEGRRPQGNRTQKHPQVMEIAKTLYQGIGLSKYNFLKRDFLHLPAANTVSKDMYVFSAIFFLVALTLSHLRKYHSRTLLPQKILFSLCWP